ncbi:MAG: TlpA family protein disulfide reductase [Gammaproteobacteria bacterium]|nr:TlpA family protein disulfide reductase [Gammaproteobacteria bacterium]
MRGVVVACGLLALTLIIAGCQSRSVDIVTITHFRLSNESIQVTSGDPIESSFSITVSYGVTDENDKVSKVTLADGPFVDGKLRLSQSVTEPTEIKIDAYAGANRRSRGAGTVLRPDSIIDFIVIRRVTTYSDYYMVFLDGNDHRSLNENLKFSIKGDLHQFNNFNPKLLEVSLQARPSFVDGIGEEIYYGPVLADEGEFSIEGDLEKPMLFSIKIHYGSKIIDEYERLHAILEPGVKYQLVQLGNQGTYAVLADRDSLHTQLVSSWQLDPEYVALIDTWVDQRLDAKWGIEREAEEEHEKELVRNYRVAKQCDHLSLTDGVKSRFIEPYQHSFESTADLILAAREETLRKILRDTQDPELARMIVDLSWQQIEYDDIYSVRDGLEKVAMLLELQEKMDQDYVDQFITPRVEYLSKEMSMKLRSKELLPGDIAPQFTLPTISGDEFSLSEVLSENELVLVDFWASWCGECTRSFSALKEIYSEYKDRGFEVITISIDDSFEEWESASMEFELPWIDLGDIADGVRTVDSRPRPAADDYGVLWTSDSLYDWRLYENLSRGGTPLIPEKSPDVGRRSLPFRFLIDKKGCIVDKRFSHYQLKNLLSSR